MQARVHTHPHLCIDPPLIQTHDPGQLQMCPQITQGVFRIHNSVHTLVPALKKAFVMFLQTTDVISGSLANVLCPKCLSKEQLSEPADKLLKCFCVEKKRLNKLMTPC